MNNVSRGAVRCSRGLYGRSNEPAPHHTARERHDVSTHPPERRDGDGPLTKTDDAWLDARDERRSPKSPTLRTKDGNDVSPSVRRRRAVARESRMPRSQRRGDPNGPDARSSQMLLLLADSRARDHNAGLGPGVATTTSAAKPTGAAMNIKKPQPPG